MSFHISRYLGPSSQIFCCLLGHCKSSRENCALTGPVEYKKKNSSQLVRSKEYPNLNNIYIKAAYYLSTRVTVVFNELSKHLRLDVCNKTRSHVETKPQMERASITQGKWHIWQPLDPQFQNFFPLKTYKFKLFARKHKSFLSLEE